MTLQKVGVSFAALDASCDLDTLAVDAANALGAATVADANAAAAVAAAAAASAAAAAAVAAVAWLSVKAPPFNAVGNGVHDDTTNIAAAITAAVALGGATIYFPPGTYKITAGLTFPDGVGIWMDSASRIIAYPFVGPAITLSGWARAYARGIRIQRSAATWHDLATDVSSEGVRILDCVTCRIEVIECFNFWIGVNMRSVNGAVGCIANTVTLGLIDHCMRGLAFTIAGGGFSNQNTFVGGSIHLEPSDLVAGVPVVGSKYIDLTTAGNGNTFVGVDLEDADVECNIDVGGHQGNNWWFSCRVENVKMVRFGATAFGNGIIGGYSNPGMFDGTVWLEAVSGGNFLLGSFGNCPMTTAGYGTSGGDALTNGVNFFPAFNLGALTDNSSLVAEYKDASGVTALRIQPDGKHFGFPAGATFAASKWDLRAGSWYTGDGTQAPSLIFVVFDQNRVDIKKRLNVAAGARITYNNNSIAGATPDVSGGNYFVLTQAGATNVTDFLNGINGQPIRIAFGDANSTVKNGASIRTKSGADFTPGAGEVIDFQNLGGAWSEVGR